MTAPRKYTHSLILYRDIGYKMLGFLVHIGCLGSGAFCVLHDAPQRAESSICPQQYASLPGHLRPPQTAGAGVGAGAQFVQLAKHLGSRIGGQEMGSEGSRLAAAVGFRTGCLVLVVNNLIWYPHTQF